MECVDEIGSHDRDRRRYRKKSHLPMRVFSEQQK